MRGQELCYCVLRNGLCLISYISFAGGGGGGGGGSGGGGVSCC